MSPEQALAKRVAIDARTDVFSAGVVLYELLTLRRPFTGRTPQEVLFQITFKEPERLRALEPRIPKDLEVICAKAMDKNPRHRYASAGEFSADLRRFLAHESIQARPPSVGQRSLRWIRRNRLGVVAATMAVVASAAGFGVADRASENAHREQALVPLRAFAASRASVPLEERSVDELWARLVDIANVRESIGRLEQADRNLLDELEMSIRSIGSDLRDEGRALVRAHTDDRDRSSDFEYVSGWIKLRDASQLLPGDAELAEQSHWRALLPRISVESDGPPASVTLEPIDPVSGHALEPIELGRTPLHDVRVPPGYYRVVVRNERGTAELTRHVAGMGGTVAVRATPRSEAEVTADMVRIPGGDFVFGQAKTKGPVYSERIEHVDAFFIDRYEVTSSQYKRFCDETGREYPHFWKGRYEPRWDDLPVIGVNFYDARAYAEWAGKRLPTRFEWERAARGEHGRKLPWTDVAELPADEVRRHAVIGCGEPKKAADRIRAAFDFYLANVEPGGSRPQGATPEGVHNLLGNLHEWTESVLVDMVEGQPRPLWTWRFVKGSSFQSRETHFSLTPAYHIPTFMADWEDTPDVGFRCARSADP